MDADGHEPGDIIVCLAKSFLNRHQRGNMKLNQCKFFAIDEIDDLYKHDKEGLAKLLEITSKEDELNTICCSATMKKEFMEFYSSILPNHIPLNLVSELEEEKERVTLEGVKNYQFTFKEKMENKTPMFEFIIKDIFKQLYSEKEKKKPQIFIFFNSIKDIASF